MLYLTIQAVLSLFLSYKVACVPEHGTGMDRIVLAQLTQLYMTLKLECPFYEVKYVKL